MKHKTSFTYLIGGLALGATIWSGTGAAFANTATSSTSTAASTTTATTTTSTTSVTTKVTVAQLAEQIVSLANRVDASSTLKAEAAPLSSLLSSSTFDWSMALFGTDKLNAAQSASLFVLKPALVKFATFSVTDESTVENLIQTVVKEFQIADSTLTQQSALLLLESLESNLAFGVLPVIQLIESGVGTTSNGSSDSTTGSTADLRAALQAASPKVVAAVRKAVVETFMAAPVTFQAFFNVSASNSSSGTTGSTATDTGSSITETSAGSGPAVGTAIGLHLIGTANRHVHYGVSGKSGFYVDGELVTAAPVTKTKGGTWVSLASTMQFLKRLGATSTWNGRNDAWSIVVPKGTQVSGNGGHTGQGKVSVTIDGKGVYRMNDRISENASGQATSYVPVGVVVPLLRHLGLKVHWNGNQMDVVMK